MPDGLTLPTTAGWTPFADPALLVTSRQSGTIVKLNRRNHRIKLTNGKWYIVPEVIEMQSLSVGERVEIQYELVRHHYYASAIKPL